VTKNQISQDAGPTASVLWPWLALAAATVTGLWMTLPWDNLAAPALGWHWFDPLDLLDIGRIALFGTLGFAAGAIVATRRALRFHTAMLTIALGAVLMEGVQFIMKQHTCSGREAILAILAAVSGGCVALRLMARDRLGSSLRLWSLVMILLIVAYLGFSDVGWHDDGVVRSRAPTIGWLPLRTLDVGHIQSVLVGSAGSVVIYAILVLMCMIAAPDGQRAVSLFLLLGVIAVIQLIQTMTGRDAADVTPLLLGAAAWLITTRVWRALSYKPRTRSLRRHGPGP
jgi:hypothetical protein